MRRQSEIKKAVLRGVYEENAGIPRSSHGKRRTADAMQPPAPSGVPWYRSKAAVIILIGIVSLLGVNFRLIIVHSTEPVAMQLDANQPLDYLAFAEAVPASEEPLPALAHTAIDNADYETMLSRLDRPMADLFNLKVQTIVIDPGHGGIDPGATGHQGLMEKDVALDIAKRLRDKLVRNGNYRVLLTREDDIKVYLKERVAFAKENRADLFISIHINSVPDRTGKLNYVETYYFGPHTEQRSLELAEQENRDSQYTMAEFRDLITRIGDTLKSEESMDLAQTIHRQLYHDLSQHSDNLVDAGTKPGPFVVLLGVEVPSVLVEVSCISNKAEETRLSRSTYRDNVAGILKTGIVEYLKQREFRRTIEGGKTQHVASQER
jgi:N-acetylmuramoyl-L-alanine amidase